MHIPDGFIDAGTSVGAGVVAAGGVGVSLRRAGQVLDEKRVAAGRAGRRLHLRGADAQLPGGQRHERPPARRGARRGAGRPVRRRAVRRGRAGRAGAAVRRRRAVRPRAERRSTWRSSPRSAATRCSSCSGGSSRRPPAASSSPPAIAAGVGVVLASLAFTVEYAIGGTGGASIGDRRRRDGRRARPHRHRRGRDHRADRRAPCWPPDPTWSGAPATSPREPVAEPAVAGRAWREDAGRARRRSSASVWPSRSRWRSS